jgi:2-oxoglutarate ferredoxin oxidoreductase subunit alpha
MEVTDLRIMRRRQQIEKNEVRYKEYFMDDAKIAIIGYGSAGRVALSAVRHARSKGIPVGLVRPISVSPFPTELVSDIAKKVDNILVVEMNSGMMLDDVLMAVQSKTQVEFYGRMGGLIPFPEEIVSEIERIAKGSKPFTDHPRNVWLDRMDSIIAR